MPLTPDADGTHVCILESFQLEGLHVRDLLYVYTDVFIVGLPTRTQAPKQQRLCLSSSPWVPVHKAGPNLNWCLDICGVKMNDHRECLQRRGSS